MTNDFEQWLREHKFAKSESMKKVIAFEFKPGKVRKGWICVDCAGPFWKLGQFHDPVVVPVENLLTERCMCCSAKMASQ